MGSDALRRPITVLEEVVDLIQYLDDDDDDGDENQAKNEDDQSK